MAAIGYALVTAPAQGLPGIAPPQPRTEASLSPRDIRREWRVGVRYNQPLPTWKTPTSFASPIGLWLMLILMGNVTDARIRTDSPGFRTSSLEGLSSAPYSVKPPLSSPSRSSLVLTLMPTLAQTKR